MVVPEREFQGDYTPGVIWVLHSSPSDQLVPGTWFLSLWPQFGVEEMTTSLTGCSRNWKTRNNRNGRITLATKTGRGEYPNDTPGKLNYNSRIVEFLLVLLVQ